MLEKGICQENSLIEKVFRINEVEEYTANELLNTKSCILLCVKANEAKRDVANFIYCIGQYKYMYCHRCGHDSIDFIADFNYDDSPIHGYCHICHQTNDIMDVLYQSVFDDKIDGEELEKISSLPESRFDRVAWYGAPKVNSETTPDMNNNLDE